MKLQTVTVFRCIGAVITSILINVGVGLHVTAIFRDKNNKNKDMDMTRGEKRESES